MKGDTQMRVSVVCLMIAVLLLVVAPLAAYAQEQPANAAAAGPPPAAAGAPGDVAQANGSFLDVNLYLSVQEVFQILARIGVIPQAVAEQALTASKDDAAPGDGAASYVKITVHMRLSEIAPLVAAMGQVRARAVPMRNQGMRQEPPAAALEPPAKKSAK